MGLTRSQNGLPHQILELGGEGSQRSAGTLLGEPSSAVVLDLGPICGYGDPRSQALAICFTEEESVREAT